LRVISTGAGFAFTNASQSRTTKGMHGRFSLILNTNLKTVGASLYAYGFCFILQALSHF
jgi:hypothetical protein